MISQAHLTRSPDTAFQAAARHVRCSSALRPYLAALALEAFRFVRRCGALVVPAPSVGAGAAALASSSNERTFAASFCFQAVAASTILSLTAVLSPTEQCDFGLFHSRPLLTISLGWPSYGIRGSAAAMACRCSIQAATPCGTPRIPLPLAVRCAL